MKPAFHETQRFTQWWLWLLLLGLSAITIAGIIQQIILGQPFGNKPMPDTGLIIFAVSTFGLLLLFRLMKLETNIDEEGINMRFIPFVKKYIPWKEVEKAEITAYGFVGGWGIRLWTKYGTVYNIKGSRGLALQLKNKKKLLIGTQKEEELKKLLQKIRV